MAKTALRYSLKPVTRLQRTYQKMEVRKVFEEHISGAKKNDERPVLCEAIKYCKENRIDVILVSELSRLGRNDSTEDQEGVRELRQNHPVICALLLIAHD